MEIISYEQYRKQLFYSDDPYFGKASIEKELKEFEDDLIAIKNRTMGPAKIVGRASGYKNPRKIAIGWLEEGIEARKYWISSEGDKPVCRSNYEYALRNNPEKLQKLQ